MKKKNVYVIIIIFFKNLNFFSRLAVLRFDKCYCDNDIQETHKIHYSLCNTQCFNKSQNCGGVDAMSYYVMNGK